MSDVQINLIVNILMVDYHVNLEGDADNKKIKLVETAKLILAKLTQQQNEKAEAQSKLSEELNKDIDMNRMCSGCYVPNSHCRCSTKN